jgi:hypothetical protein
MDPIERRNVERLSVRLQGVVFFDLDGKEKEEPVTVTQISAFSVYFESAIPLDITDTVRITVQMEESEPPFQALGTVIRVDELEKSYGCTVKFEEPPQF